MDNLHQFTCLQPPITGWGRFAPNTRMRDNQWILLIQMKQGNPIKTYFRNLAREYGVAAPGLCDTDICKKAARVWCHTAIIRTLEAPMNPFKIWPTLVCGTLDSADSCCNKAPLCSFIMFQRWKYQISVEKVKIANLHNWSWSKVEGVKHSINGTTKDVTKWQNVKCTRWCSSYEVSLQK